MVRKKKHVRMEQGPNNDRAIDEVLIAQGPNCP